MGGSINLALRLRDGRAFCTDQWTNPLPIWLKHPGIYESDARMIEYMAEVKEHADYESDRYARGRPKPIQNSEYGLIVIDYVTNTILEINHYCSLNTFTDLEAAGLADHERKNNFQMLAAAGRISESRIIDAGDERWEEIGDPLTAEQAVAAANHSRKINPIMAGFGGGHQPVYRNADGTKHLYSSFVVDMSPMVLFSYRNDGSMGEFTEMKEKMREIGFPMTRAEGLNATLDLPKYTGPKE